MTSISTTDEDLIYRRGTLIFARSKNGSTFHRGAVLDSVPDLGVLWIRDDQTGLRKLIEVTDYVVTSGS